MSDSSQMATGTNVWLPVTFRGDAAATEYTVLSEKQYAELLDAYVVPTADLVCPEPLGMRQVFSWRLLEALTSKGGPALDEFALLVEGLAYGLLTTETYDLHKFQFQFLRDADRFLTVFKFQVHENVQSTIAGSFSPVSLVCPAANWQQKTELEKAVQKIRFTQQGQEARGLLKAFGEPYRAAGAVWFQALQWLLTKYSPLADPGPRHQRNIGPLLLSLADDADPVLVFFPQHSRDFMQHVVRCFQADEFDADSEKLDLRYQGNLLASVLMPLQIGHPQLFGLGGVQISNPAVLPVQTSFDNAAEARYWKSVQTITGLYAAQFKESNWRFQIPDALRCAYEVWGTAARGRVWPAAQSNLYGDRAYNAGTADKAHLRYNQAGVHRDDKNLLYLERTDDGKLAYYIERLEGTEVLELSTLGFALWKVFTGAVWDAANGRALLDGQCYLEIRAGWLGPPDTVVPRAPNPETEYKKWSTFRWVTEQAPMGLFPIAAQEFIRIYGPKDVTAAERLEFETISLQNSGWYKLHAL